MKKTYLSISILCMTGFSAQETIKDSLISNIEGIVISSQTLFPNKKIDERASSHIHIYSKELQKYNYSDVNRLIMGKSGIHTVEEDGIGLRPNISIRGAGASRSANINLMEDGVPISPAPYVSPAAYYFPNIGRMSGVEVLKGSGQIQYGPNTVGGTFNMISTQVPKKFSTMLNMSYGSFDTRKVHAHAGDRIGKFGYLVEYFNNSSNGFKELPNGKDAGFKVEDAVVKLLYDNSAASIPSKLHFKFQTSGENSNETYMGITKADFIENPYQRYIGSELDNMRSKHRQYLVSYEIKPSAKMQLNFDVYRNEFARNWYKVNDVKIGSGNYIGLANVLEGKNTDFTVMALKGLYKGGDDKIRIRNNNREYISQGIQFNGQYKIWTGGVLRFGGRYHNDREDRYQWDDIYKSTEKGLSLISKGTPGTQTNRVLDGHATSTFLQYQQEIGHFVITPGVRFENINLREKNYGGADTERTGANLKTTENKFNTIIPGISVLYQPTENVNIFGGLHKGFRPAGIKEGQKVETSWNYELGGRYNDNKIDAEVIGYINNYSNMLGADTNAIGGNASQGDLLNVGQVSVKGIESQLRYTINGKQNKINFPIAINYTFFHSKFEKDFNSDLFGKIEKGFQLPFIPTHQIGVEVGANIGNFRVSGNWKARSDFRIKPGKGEIQENQKVPKMNILDVSARYAFNKNFTLYVTGQNVLNKIYIASLYPAGLRPGMPRFVSLGIQVKL